MFISIMISRIQVFLCVIIIIHIVIIDIDITHTVHLTLRSRLSYPTLWEAAGFPHPAGIYATIHTRWYQDYGGKKWKSLNCNSYSTIFKNFNGKMNKNSALI